MNPRIVFVQDTLGFRFENGFLAKFRALGEPAEDLEFWYRNAQVLLEVCRTRPIPDEKRDDLLTLIESIRIGAQTLDPALGLEDLDISVYGFTEDIASCKTQVLSLVLAQESRSDWVPPP